MTDNLDGYYFALCEGEVQEGVMKKVTVEGNPILFIKLKGRIFAINNRCPHMACELSGGTLVGDVIICPCHDWRFNLETGEYEDNPWFKLTKYDWIAKLGKILVKMDE